jgi:hypothetical protein
MTPASPPDPSSQFEPPDFSSRPSGPRSEVPWVPIAFGGIFLAVVVGLAILLISGKTRQRPGGPGPYATQVILTEAKISQAQNFVGGVVTYLDGTVANTGDQAVASAEVEAVFKNSLGQTVQQETQPLKILRRTGPYPEALDLSFVPLAPHQQAEFRLIFEHISADWDQQVPALRLVSVRTK